MVKFYVVLEIFVVFMLSLGLTTQVLIPTLKGTPLFPFLRKRTKRVAEKVAAKIEKEELDAIEERLKVDK